jgi:osmotically-inducible protein OsmY
MKFKVHQIKEEKYKMDKIINRFSKQLQKMIQANDAFKEAWKIEVFEENGIVTLEGAVPSRDILEKAETFIKEQEGVEAVVNKLDIDPDLEAGEEEISIEKEDYVPPIRNHPG